MRVKISAVIICFNEQKNIERCIGSVRPIADEILVLDSYSTDKTPAICKQLGVRFEQHSFDGHIEQKNRAMAMASNNVILSLDADEALDEQLTKNILATKHNWQADAYSFNRLTQYCGQWIKHCGWYPDTKLRLWDRRKGDWGGENPHDKVIMLPNTNVIKLKGDLLHYSFYTVEQHLDTVQKFSSIKAQNKLNKGKTSSWFQLYLHPLGKFLKMYVLKLGFLDGKMGWLVCKYSAYAAFLKHYKVRKASL
ncbi:MAG: glycosyltransferase family 2 protein [Bacteroidia bacterium]